MNWLNTIVLLGAAFVAVFLEASCDGFRRLFGAQIDVLPALMVYASLTCEIGGVALLAALGGLLVDALSYNPLGVSILPLFAVGFLIHPRRGLILREQLYARYVLGIAAGAAVPLLKLLILLSMRRSPGVGWGTLWQLIVLSAGSGVLTPLCFWFFDAFDRAINYLPVAESSFRPDREIRRGRN
jgi:cell shape-determining protein MreD